MEGYRVTYKVRDEIAWITIERPEKLNALDERTWLELADAVTRADEDDAVKCIVLTGSGRAFSAGDDIGVMRMLATVEDAERFFYKIVGRAVDALLRCSKPVIMAVNGLAYGGGMELLLLADVVIAREDAVFSVPEAKLGLFPPLMTTLGVLTLGLKRVLWLSLTCSEITAEEAQRMGIVDVVVSKDRFNEEVMKVCRVLKNIPTTSLRTIKRVAMRWRSLALTPTVLSELATLCLTGEARGRMERFLKK